MPPPGLPATTLGSLTSVLGLQRAVALRWMCVWTNPGHTLQLSHLSLLSPLPPPKSILSDSSPAYHAFSEPTERARARERKQLGAVAEHVSVQDERDLAPPPPPCHSGSHNTTAGQSVVHSPPMRTEGVGHGRRGGGGLPGARRHFPEVPNVLEMRGWLLCSLHLLFDAVNREQRWEEEEEE